MTTDRTLTEEGKMTKRCTTLEAEFAKVFGARKEPRKPQPQAPTMTPQERAEKIARLKARPGHPPTCAAIVNRRNADCDCGAL